MPGLDVWPKWPEYTESDVPAAEEQQLRQYKKEIVAEYGEESIRRAWVKTCSELAVITEEIRQKGSSVIPELSFDEFQNIPNAEIARLKNVGCFVIRGVIPREEASEQFKKLKKYVTENKDSLSGMMFQYFAFHCAEQTNK